MKEFNVIYEFIFNNDFLVKIVDFCKYFFIILWIVCTYIAKAPTKSIIGQKINKRNSNKNLMAIPNFILLKLIVLTIAHIGESKLCNFDL